MYFTKQSIFYLVCHTKGVRQGDPCLPWLFLVRGEMLSPLLCQNGKIIGIKVKDEEVLLAKFALDTTLFLYSSEQTFNETMWTLHRFT